MNKAALLAWLAIAIPLAVLFGPALVSDRSFALRDAGHFYYPLFEWCCREWATGRVPLWNPLENCGVPLLADATSSVFYPGKLIFLLPINFALRYKLYIILHVVLAAAGSYGLARAWKASHPAAALAAIAFACGGGVVFQYSNVVFLVGAAWLPFAALAADRMLRLTSLRAALLLGLVLALMILGGDPQAAYHGLLVTAVYAIVRAFAQPIDLVMESGDHLMKRAHPASRVRALLVRLALVGVAAAVGILLAAVQILPSAEATRYSERAAYNRPRNIYEAASVAFQSEEIPQPLGETRRQSIARGLLAEPEERSHQELAYDFSVGPWRLAEYLWPNIGGRMFPTHRRWLSLVPAEGRTWTPTLYLGLLPVVLVLGSFRLWNGTARQRWLSLLVVIFTLGSFGYYGVGWLLREVWWALPRQNAAPLSIGSPVAGVYWLLVTLLPTYVYFRYPAKLLPLVSLGISQLAASGFESAFSERRPRLAQALLVFGGVSGNSALAMWCVGPRLSAKLGQDFLAWCIGPALFAKVAWSDSSLGPFDADGAYRDVRFALVQAASVALVGRWLFMKAWSEPKRASQWRLLAVLLTAIDVSAANAWLVVTAPAELWQHESPIATVIYSSQKADTPATSPPPRVYRGNLASWRPPEFRHMKSRARLAELVQWEHETLFPKHELASRISLVESYGSIKLADYESLLFVAKQHGPRQADKSLLPQPTALRLLGTQFLVLPETHQAEFAKHLAGEKSQDNAAWPEGATLWQMRRTLPRAWIVHDVEVLPLLPRPARSEAIDERSKAVLFPGEKARDFFHSAVVETNEPLAGWNRERIGPSNADAVAVADERCQFTHYEPNRVVVEAELYQPGLLVLSDAWYPGWVAIVTHQGESRESPIYRTDRVCRGVWLLAGKHSVEFRFQSHSLLRGAWISGLSWLFLFAVLTSWLTIGRGRAHLWHAF